jgi:hypothetical protein
MSTLIGKFSKDGTDYYFDYSTESGEPAKAMRLEEYREHYLKLHGRIGLSKLGDRLGRADAKGTSAHKRANLDDMLKGNKAGDGHRELSTQEVIDLLLTRRGEAAAQR